MQNLRERLLRTLNVLDTHLEVVEGCIAYCQNLSGGRHNADEELLLELDAHSAQLRTHRRVTVAILDRSQGTLELVSSGHIVTTFKRQALNQISSYSGSLNIAMTRARPEMVLR